MRRGSDRPGHSGFSAAYDALWLRPAAYGEKIAAIRVARRGKWESLAII